jgi:hypothetical protein
MARVLVGVQGTSTRSPSSTLLPSLHEYSGCIPYRGERNKVKRRRKERAAALCRRCSPLPLPPGSTADTAVLCGVRWARRSREEEEGRGLVPGAPHITVAGGSAGHGRESTLHRRRADAGDAGESERKGRG